jgi:hypothetical protein
VVNDVRKRDAVRRHAARLIIEPDIRRTGKVVERRGVSEDDAHSTVVFDVLSLRPRRAQDNEHQHQCEAEFVAQIRHRIVSEIRRVVLLDGHSLTQPQERVARRTARPMTMEFADDALHSVERIRSEVGITNAGHPRHVVRRRGRPDSRSKAPEFLGEA